MNRQSDNLIRSLVLGFIILVGIGFLLYWLARPADQRVPKEIHEPSSNGRKVEN